MHDSTANLQIRMDHRLKEADEIGLDATSTSQICRHHHPARSGKPQSGSQT